MKFFKYQGAGNDFIVVDNRDKKWHLSEQQISGLCNRRTGIGGDGLMLLQEAQGYDFEMRYYNADGRLGSMCGNGGRCIVAFAYQLGLFEEFCTFLAYDGAHTASVKEQGRLVNLQMRDVDEIQAFGKDWVLDTGSPHYIKKVSQLDAYPVVQAGREIRNQAAFPEGVNVNFIEPITHGYAVRTYERGVEDETLACGTGVTAVALAMAHEKQELGKQHTILQVPGGTLKVTFNYLGGQQFREVFLEGPAELVFSGNVNLT